MGYKYSTKIYSVDDDGDLKFLTVMNTDLIPVIGTTIICLIRDDLGNFVQRLYCRVIDVLLPTIKVEDNLIEQFKEGGVILHVKIEVNEPCYNQ